MPPPPPPQQAPELPALGPQDINDLFHCLQQSLSNDVRKQKAAESALRQLESRKGFCSCLAVRDQSIGHAALEFVLATVLSTTTAPQVLQNVKILVHA